MFYVLLNTTPPAFICEDCQQIDREVGAKLCHLFEKDDIDLAAILKKSKKRARDDDYSVGIKHIFKHLKNYSL